MSIFLSSSKTMSRRARKMRRGWPTSSFTSTTCQKPCGRFPASNPRHVIGSIAFALHAVVVSQASDSPTLGIRTISNRRAALQRSNRSPRAAAAFHARLQRTESKGRTVRFNTQLTAVNSAKSFAVSAFVCRKQIVQQFGVVGGLRLESCHRWLP